MEISPIGIIAIPLGLIFFGWRRKVLIWTTIIFIPLFEVIVIELPFAPIRAFQYFGCLAIIRHLIDRAIHGEIKFRLSMTLFSSLLFVGVVFFSLFMPTLVSEAIYIAPEGVGGFLEAYKDPKRLTFDFSNITQVLYPFFGVSMFYLFCSNLNYSYEIKKIIRILLFGMFLLFAFSLLSKIFYIIGGGHVIDTVFYLMTRFNGADFSTYNAIGGLVRSKTLAGEPGYTGLYYLLVLGILGGLAGGGYVRGWAPRYRKLLLYLLVAAILINSSTTAYFGVVSLGVSFFFVSMLRKNREITSGRSTRVLLRILLAAGGTFILLVVSLQAAGISLVEFILENHLAKLTETAGSGAIRLYSVQYSLTEVFAESPLFGVGYGSHRALSLIVFLLSNIGIVGVAAFLLFNGIVFGHAVHTMNNASDPELASIAFALAVTHPAFLLTLFVGKSETSFSFGWLWLLLAMMEACYRIYRTRKHDRIVVA